MKLKTTEGNVYNYVPSWREKRGGRRKKKNQEHKILQKTE